MLYGGRYSAQRGRAQPNLHLRPPLILSSSSSSSRSSSRSSAAIQRRDDSQVAEAEMSGIRQKSSLSVHAPPPHGVPNRLQLALSRSGGESSRTLKVRDTAPQTDEDEDERKSERNRSVTSRHHQPTHVSTAHAHVQPMTRTGMQPHMPSSHRPHPYRSVVSRHMHPTSASSSSSSRVTANPPLSVSHQQHHDDRSEKVIGTAGEVHTGIYGPRTYKGRPQRAQQKEESMEIDDGDDEDDDDDDDDDLGQSVESPDDDDDDVIMMDNSKVSHTRTSHVTDSSGSVSSASLSLTADSLPSISSSSSTPFGPSSLFHPSVECAILLDSTEMADLEPELQCWMMCARRVEPHQQTHDHDDASDGVPDAAESTSPSGASVPSPTSGLGVNAIAIPSSGVGGRFYSCWCHSASLGRSHSYGAARRHIRAAHGGLEPDHIDKRKNSDDEEIEREANRAAERQARQKAQVEAQAAAAAMAAHHTVTSNPLNATRASSKSIMSNATVNVTGHDHPRQCEIESNPPPHHAAAGVSLQLAPAADRRRARSI